MNYLVTNDDGIKSIGINVLVSELSKHGNVYLIAPDSERSAASHSVTIKGALYLQEEEYEGATMAFSCSGTPVDSIKVGVDYLRQIGIKIDMIFSGINHGRNLGIDTIYSGTVGAAREGMIIGMPSFALSIAGNFATQSKEELYYDYPKLIIKRLAKLDPKKLKDNLLLNINFPNLKKEEIKGIKFTKLHSHGYNEWFRNTENKNGRLKFEFTGIPQYKKTDEVNDVNLLNDGYVTISPIKIIQDDERDFKNLEEVLTAKYDI